MQVTLVIDEKHGHFTNFDIITGTVFLHVPFRAPLSSIVVKLEGESRTHLWVATRPGYRERPRPVLEVHKLLYRIQTVWPPDGYVDPRDPQKFDIAAGQHEFPFQFKIPINNACVENQNQSNNISLAGLSLDFVRPPAGHIKATLPPSLYLAGEVEVRYYVKVTVNRPSLLKENPRAFASFNFMPIEPPRNKPDGEVYARRKHEFTQKSSLSASSMQTPIRRGSNLKGLFTRKSINGIAGSDGLPPASPIDGEVSKTQPIAATGVVGPARFGIDARLPNPAILTCGEPVPLRLLITQLSPRSENLVLHSLQVELVAHTKVRAHEAVKVESTSWVVFTQANMNYIVGNPEDAVDTLTEISTSLWNGRNLPNTVAPTFTACNVARRYELLVNVGLNYGEGKSQLTILPLRHQVQVLSGIKPPEMLLSRLGSERISPSSPRPTSMPLQPPRPGQSGPSTVTAQTTDPNLPGFEEPPPSYEDAVASDIPPVDGPRPEYRPPPGSAGEHGLGEGRKGR